jgi:hypothetical protein
MANASCASMTSSGFCSALLLQAIHTAIACYSERRKEFVFSPIIFTMVIICNSDASLPLQQRVQHNKTVQRCSALPQSLTRLLLLVPHINEQVGFVQGLNFYSWQLCIVIKT